LDMFRQVDSNVFTQLEYTAHSVYVYTIKVRAHSMMFTQLNIRRMFTRSKSRPVRVCVYTVKARVDSVYVYTVNIQHNVCYGWSDKKKIEASHFRLQLYKTVQTRVRVRVAGRVACRVRVACRFLDITLDCYLSTW